MDKKYARILWIGKLPPRNGQDLGVLAGLECEEPVGQGNGMYKGTRYFQVVNLTMFGLEIVARGSLKMFKILISPAMTYDLILLLSVQKTLTCHPCGKSILSVRGGGGEN